MFDDDATVFPQKGDKLFVTGDDWQNNALLHFVPDSRGLYIAGYKYAGDRLAQSLIEDRSHQDALILPIVFLYRHYIELCLKYITSEGKALLDEGENEKAQKKETHSLRKLWQECKTILDAIGIEHGMYAEKDIVESVDAIIIELADKDDRSDGFRYPFDLKSNVTLHGLEVINVRNLKEIMARVALFFDTESIAISELLKNRRDYD